jgi:hypothetical protein
LAWVRCVLNANTDVSNGEQLSKSAPNTFPKDNFWFSWSLFFEVFWNQHINNIIKIIEQKEYSFSDSKYCYEIIEDGVSQLIEVLNKALYTDQIFDYHSSTSIFNVQLYTPLQMFSFIHHTVTGFLKADLYTAMTELLSRAEGSFGLQAHCSIEPGVVVIASKGQPMSVSFDNSLPICLFGSEADALAVPINKQGKHLKNRLDLDSHGGEIVRIGKQKMLIDGSFARKRTRNNNIKSVTTTTTEVTAFSDSDFYDQYPNDFNIDLISPRTKKNMIKNYFLTSPKVHVENLKPTRTIEVNTIQNSADIKSTCLILDSGIELRCYSLQTSAEIQKEKLLDRCVLVTSAPLVYNDNDDLVKKDLNDTPAVLYAINNGFFFCYYSIIVFILKLYSAFQKTNIYLKLIFFTFVIIINYYYYYYFLFLQKHGTMIFQHNA